MGQNRRLVILEDDVGTRMLLRSVAETSGWSVEHGSSSADVAHALPHADALTLDVHLEAENGIDLLHALRDGGSTIPVIVLSGDDDPAVEAAARAAGASHFMLKPFDVSELSELLDEIRRGPIPNPVIDLTKLQDQIDLTDGPVSLDEPEPAEEKAWFMS